MKGDFYKRVVAPALIPIGAFVFIGALVFAFSRILLVVTTDGSVVVAVVMAAAILFACAAVAAGGAIKRIQQIGLLAAAFVLLVGGIASGALMHTRPVEKHEVATCEGGAAPAGAVAITAQGSRFDLPELRLPAQNPIVRFVNNDAGVDHNFAIYENETPTAKELFKGTIFKGVAARNCKIKDVPQGVYFFRCDLHPATMTGSVAIGSGLPGAGGPGGGTTTGASTGGTSGGIAGPAGSAATAGPPATSVALVAEQLHFDRTAFALVANVPVSVNVDNKDAGVTHNFVLYRDRQFQNIVFNGDPVTGPATKRYQFTSPAAGEYYYRCIYHPATMTGTAVVR